MITKIIIIVLLILIQSYDTDDYMEDRLDIDLSSCTIIEKKESEPSFNGDGDTFITLSCNEDILNEIEDWKELPLTKNLKKMLYEVVNNSSGTDIEIPQVRNGYYYFLDRHDEATDVHDDFYLFNRCSYNFTVAIYDTDNNVLYFYEMNT